MADTPSVNEFPDGVSQDPTRRFTASERAALYVASHGRCAECGTPLTAGYHADHVIPHSAGGPTDVRNGRATCPRCNIEKAARFPAPIELPHIPLEPWRQATPRPWQQQALAAWDAQCRSSSNFTMVACPGAGKTTAACLIMRRAIEQRLVDRVIVVVPTSPLREQWAESANHAGISLHAGWMQAHSAWPAGFHGFVLTYASVSLAHTLLRQLSTARTLVVFDEIHHCADPMEGDDAPAGPWGRMLLYAFGEATYRIALSGTPFRTDGAAIPFITYDDTGVVVPDVHYSYRRAMADNVCRPITFDPYDGEMTWLSGEAELRARFDTSLAPRERSRRLRTALTAGEWLPTVLRMAHEHLLARRAEGGAHARAGGLVIAADVTHARQVVEILRQVTGERPALAVSDAQDASTAAKARDVIREFRAGSAPWLVAVRMVSEGVDIPRLCVGVYATTALTELIFRQVVGRFIRTQAEAGAYQSATMFIPRDERILTMARAIEEECVASCLEMNNTEQERESSEAGADRTAFAPLDSVCIVAGTILAAEPLPPDIVAQAQAYATALGASDWQPFAEFGARMWAAMRLNGVVPPTEQDVPLPKYQQLEQQRNAVSKVVRQLGMRLGGGTETFASLHRQLNAESGVESIDTASLEQLREQLTIARRWLVTGTVPQRAAS